MKYFSRKRALALALALTLALSLLTACGEDPAPAANGQDGRPTASAASDDTTPEQPAAEYPTGLFMLCYLGDETGEYVPESNECLDYFNQPTTLMQLLWDDCQTLWCDIGEDGKGVFHPSSYDPVAIDFNTGEPGMLLYGDSLLPYTYDAETGRFWFEEEPGFWDVMESCSQAALDLVFAGMGGTVPLAEAEVGELVCMGTYLQTRNSDTTEPIRWRVLDRDGDRVLLLCEPLLDSFSYNYNPDHAVLTDVTWETCSLRAFLNDPEGFLSMFTADEIARMQITHLENKSANEELMAQWGALEDQGEAKYSDLAVQDRPDDPDTDDRVFLLSYQEVLHYFGEPTETATEEKEYPFTVLKVNPAWLAYVTDAVTAGYYETATGGGAWMTRTLCTSHSDEDMVVYISGTGQVFDYYTYVPLFIRPAVWVSAAN